ncbi:MAG: FAD-dependent oxidoreductase [Candidatus Obscuribacterales bacterium]|nr:FAD-dependent oxidoreductase [Candidatus Obscuribacterales bacterium]
MSLTKRKLVIVGGVAGGMSAATRARRLAENWEIVVLERSGFVSYANCGLPYYVGREIENEASLIVQTPESLKERFNLDIKILHEVIGINAQEKTVTVKNLQTGESFFESYDELILSVGAKPIKPPLAGIDGPGIFTVRSIEETRQLDAWIAQFAERLLDKELDKRPKAVVCGGGFIGIETAEQLRKRGFQVTLVDGRDHILAPLDSEMAEIVQQEMERNGIKLLLGAKVLGFETYQAGTDSLPASCLVKCENHEPLAAELVILGLGVKPDTTLAREAGIELGTSGGIVVDKYLATSKDSIWAVGDAIEVRQPLSGLSTLISLGGPANRQGRSVAENIVMKAQKKPRAQWKTYNGTFGTAILRIFRLAAASIGLNEAALRQSSKDFEVVYLHPSHHAGYFPEAKRLDIKLIFDSEDGGILGAQIVGEEGVDKRIDIIATAIKAGLRINDLADLELAYAPPFGSAKDPINLAGMIGENILHRHCKQLLPQDLTAERLEETALLIDVRNHSERQRGTIEGSLHIPLSELRQRLTEIPRNRELVVFCQSGQRSYAAQRLLEQAGFQVRTLAGGYLTYSFSQQSKSRKRQGDASNPYPKQRLNEGDGSNQRILTSA